MATEGESKDDLHNPGCTCFDGSSSCSSEDSESDVGQPEPKRQRRSSSSSFKGSPPNSRINDDRISTGFEPGDFLSGSDPENDVEAIEAADLEKAIEMSKKATPADAVPPPLPNPEAPPGPNRVRPNDATFNASWNRSLDVVDSADGFLDSSSSSSSGMFDGILSVQMPVINDLGSSGSSSDEDFFRLLPSSRPVTVRAAPTSSNSDSRVYDIEFEIASIPESELNPNPLEDMDSSSGDEYEADVEFPESGEANDQVEREEFADQESEQSVDSEKDGFHSDSELEKDKWPCHKCKAMTTAVSRYCLRCFQARRNWLPERPRSRKSRRKANTRTDTGISTNFVGTDEEGILGNTGPFSPQINSNAGPSTTNNDSFQNLTPPTSTQNSQASNYELEDRQTMLRSPLKRSRFSGSPSKRAASVKASTPKSKAESSLCNICLIREKDAAFVHNKIAHRYTCFQCADKILRKSGRCPICRAKILRVVRIISV